MSFRNVSLEQLLQEFLNRSDVSEQLREARRLFSSLSSSRRSRYVNHQGNVVTRSGFVEKSTAGTAVADAWIAFRLWVESNANLTNYPYDAYITLRGFLERDFQTELYDHDLNSHKLTPVNDPLDKYATQLASDQYLLDAGDDARLFWRVLVSTLPTYVSPADFSTQAPAAFSDLPVVNTTPLVSLTMQHVISALYLRGEAVFTGKLQTTLNHPANWFYKYLIKSFEEEQLYGHINSVTPSYVLLGVFDFSCESMRWLNCLNFDTQRDFVASELTTSTPFELYVRWIIIDLDIFTRFLPFDFSNITRIVQSATSTRAFNSLGGSAVIMLSRFTPDGVAQLLARAHMLCYYDDHRQPSFPDFFVAFCLYYGIHGTCASRVEKRPAELPLYIKVPRSGGDRPFEVHRRTYVFTDVEDFFDSIQFYVRDFSVRRRLMGTIADLAFMIYEDLSVSFVDRWRYSWHADYASPYFVDFYKYLGDTENAPNIVAKHIYTPKVSPVLNTYLTPREGVGVLAYPEPPG